MSVRSQDQVELFELLFGVSWEDPSSDCRALQIQPGERVMTVTSGGCNALTLLLEDPAQSMHWISILYSRTFWS